MKRIFLISLAVFVGAFAALRIDHWISGESLFRFSFRQAYNEIKPVGFTPAELSRTPSPVGFESVAKRVIPSVVSIDTLQKQQTWGGQQFILPSGMGSGVILREDGIVVTNQHVIQDANIVRVHLSALQSPTKTAMSYEARVLGADPVSDIAVLKIKANKLVAAKIGDSSKLRPGEWILAVGNPLGYENTLTVGIVSNMNQTLPTESSILVDTIQTDASINPGNSGGALANKFGEVVGIPTVIASHSGGSEGISFAIPITRALRSVNDILKYGYVQYGWLGVTVANSEMLSIGLNRERLEVHHRSSLPDTGLIIKKVNGGSPAQLSGMKSFDVLLAIDDKRMDKPIDFISYIVNKRPGDKTAIKYWSQGKIRRVTVRLADLPRI